MVPRARSNVELALLLGLDGHVERGVYPGRDDPESTAFSRPRKFFSENYLNKIFKALLGSIKSDPGRGRHAAAKSNCVDCQSTRARVRRGSSSTRRT